LFFFSYLHFLYFIILILYMIYKIKDRDLVSLHDKGLSDKEIAAILGVTQAAINYRRKKLGLKNNCWNRDFTKAVCPHCGKQIVAEYNIKMFPNKRREAQDEMR
jgi:5-bromo-4-chloroindolyl phosphate hydrolysis protein